MSNLRFGFVAGFVALGLAACVAPVDEELEETGEVAQAAQSGPLLCVLTIDCGGFCGTAKQIKRFLNTCDKKSNHEPVGPCFSSCWNVCIHAASKSQSPNPVACTKECMTGLCGGHASKLEIVE